MKFQRCSLQEFLDIIYLSWLKAIFCEFFVPEFLDYIQIRSAGIPLCMIFPFVPYFDADLLYIK